MSMIYQTIRGEDVPALGLGTWQFTGDACRKGVLHALSYGYRHIDTAQVYNNETQVGKALSETEVDRDDIFLTTKIWADNLNEDDLRPSVEESLRDLQTEYVDLLLIHWPQMDLSLEKALDQFRAIQDEGKTRHIGVSNFTSDLVKRAQEHVDIFCNQVEYHPFLAQHQLTRMAREDDFLLTAYSPLARGRVMDDDNIQTIAEAHEKSPAQVTLRWLIQQKNVAAIPKASSKEHRESNFDIFDFELSQQEMGYLFDLARGERLVEPDGLTPDW